MGTRYHGWQVQPDGNTIQNKLNQSLELILQANIKSVGGSRTDSGVHALSQFVKIELEPKISPEQLQKALNGVLPLDIRVLNIEKCEPDFHPIRHAKAKLYKYTIWRQKRCLNPFITPYVWPMGNLKDLTPLKDLIAVLIGKHNFKSFCASDSSAETFERNLMDIKVAANENRIDFWFLGEGFLKQMIRNIVGTLVECLQKKQTPDDLRGILESCDRRCAGMTAPASGLTLIDVFFEDFNNNLVELVQRKDMSFWGGVHNFTGDFI